MNQQGSPSVGTSQKREPVWESAHKCGCCNVTDTWQEVRCLQQAMHLQLSVWCAGDQPFALSWAVHMGCWAGPILLPGIYAHRINYTGPFVLRA